MIYLIGGAPRAGKSLLGRQLAANMNTSWISTDLLLEMLRVKQIAGVKTTWDATSESIVASAEWFFPCLERFVWRVSTLTEHYIIEGVDFLPAQVAQLSSQYQLQAVFLGRSNMTLTHFDQHPGLSPGYAKLPEALRQQMAQDVPRWSNFVREEAERFGYPYLDTISDFPSRLREAEALLRAKAS